MNPLYLSLVLILIVAQLVLPRRYGFAPLLFAAYHVGNVEFIGDFTIHRALILIGIIRAISGGFFRFSSKSKMDVLFFLFALIAMLTAIAHSDINKNPYIANIGLILNVCGTYFYGKSYLFYDNWPEVFAFTTILAVIPLAILMLAEKINAKNYYSILGTTSSFVNIRDGEVRARGSFAHSILGGTSGSVSFPICFILFQIKRKLAVVGMICCIIITIASASSGPLASLMVAVACILFWRKRRYLKQVIWFGVFVIIIFDLIMERPFYYIIAYIDLTGSSTSWHRCRLIESAFEHFGEWWLYGTDFTRHWMPSGVSWSPNHTDITNYYLHLGVIGGLFLMLTLIGMIMTAISIVLRCNSFVKNENSKQEFTFWCLGAAIVAHAATFISVSYFDQIYVLFYLLTAGIEGLPNLSAKTDRFEKNQCESLALN